MPFHSLRISSLVTAFASKFPLATSHATRASRARSLVEGSPLASARQKADSPSRTGAALPLPLLLAAAEGRGAIEGLSGRAALTFLLLLFWPPPSESWSDGMMDGSFDGGDGDDEPEGEKKQKVVFDLRFLLKRQNTLAALRLFPESIFKIFSSFLRDGEINVTFFLQGGGGATESSRGGKAPATTAGRG